MKERTRINDRIIACLLAFALIFAAAIALSGCQSKEQQAEASVKALLDDYKNGALDVLNSTDDNELTKMNIDENELISALTEDFSYEIKGSKENADEGTIDVEVTIHSKQLASAIKNSLPNMMSYAFGAALSGYSEADIQEQLTTMLIEQLKQEEAVDTTVTVPTQEQSGDVDATDAGKQAIANAILGDMNAVQQSLSSSASQLDTAV